MNCCFFERNKKRGWKPYVGFLNIPLIIFSKEIHDYIINYFECEVIGEIRACNGSTKFYSFRYGNERIAFYLTTIGSTMASQFCIECNWIIGASKFIMFGSAGSLDREKTTGKFIIPTHAYRDEGMSYHYAPPQDYIEVNYPPLL